MFSLVLRIVALICFILSAVGIPIAGLALMPVGFACWVGSTLTNGK